MKKKKSSRTSQQAVIDNIFDSARIFVKQRQDLYFDASNNSIGSGATYGEYSFNRLPVNSGSVIESMRGRKNGIRILRSEPYSVKVEHSKIFNTAKIITSRSVVKLETIQDRIIVVDSLPENMSNIRSQEIRRNKIKLLNTNDTNYTSYK